MNKISRSVFFTISVVALGLGGCADTAGEGDALPPAGSTSEEVDKSKGGYRGVALTSRDTEFPYDTVQNTQDLFSRLDSHDRGVARAFYGAYSSTVMEFARNEQLEWMSKGGYPMPSDVVAAEKLTDGELLKDFQQGDVVSGFLYYDRRISQLLSSGGKYEGLYELDELELKLIATGSPFAGYAIARRHMELDGDLDAAMAGLAWAQFRGDHRAGMEMARLIGIANERKPGRVDPASLLFSFINVQQTALMADPTLLQFADPIPWDSVEP